MRAHELLELRREIAAYHVGLLPEIQTEVAKLEAASNALKEAHGYLAISEAAKKSKLSADEYSVKVRSEADVVLVKAQSTIAEAEHLRADAQRMMDDSAELVGNHKLELATLRDQRQKALAEIQTLEARRETLLKEQDRFRTEIADREAILLAREQALKLRLKQLLEPV